MPSLIVSQSKGVEWSRQLPRSLQPGESRPNLSPRPFEARWHFTRQCWPLSRHGELSHLFCLPILLRHLNPFSSLSNSRDSLVNCIDPIRRFAPLLPHPSQWPIKLRRSSMFPASSSRTACSSSTAARSVRRVSYHVVPSSMCFFFY